MAEVCNGIAQNNEDLANVASMISFLAREHSKPNYYVLFKNINETERTMPSSV